MPISIEKMESNKALLKEGLENPDLKEATKIAVDSIMSDEDMSDIQKGELWVYIAECKMDQTIAEARK